MKSIFKKIIKFCGKILISTKIIRKSLRLIISSSKFLSDESRYKLRGALESLAPEEILKAKSDFLGYTFYYPNKSIVGIKASESGLWNDFSGLFDAFLKKAETIVEIGSNIGMDTMLMAKKAPQNCEIIAFEPCDKFRAILERNIKENNLKNIAIYDYFLTSDSDFQRNLYITSSSASAIKDVTESFPTIAKQTCKSVTFDNFFQKTHSLKSLNFLKIDTDGWDQKVIEGGIHTIKKFKPFLYVEFCGYLLQKAGDSNASLAQLLHQLGYNDFLLFQEKEQHVIKIQGYKKLLGFLTTDSASDVFAIPQSKINFLK